MGAKSASGVWDRRIAQLAERQHGVVARSQLLRCGVTRSGLRRRLEAGRLHPVHRGVYAVGHVALADEGRWMAAVLACAPRPSLTGEIRETGDPAGATLAVLERWGAALSHRSAAELWRLLPGDRGRPVHVVAAGDNGRRRRRGICLHRSPSLSQVDVTLHRGIPVTTPRRTIADLRRVASGQPGAPITPRELRQAIRQAEVICLPLGRPGGRSDRTRSELERAFLRLCRRYRLPLPEVNVRVGPYLVDFLWRHAGVVVETDGYRYHRGRVAFEEDRERDLALRARGIEVLRLSARQVFDDPAAVVAAMGSALGRTRAPAKPSPLAPRVGSDGDETES
jgi:very-short-patch-repair endonuclease